MFFSNTEPTTYAAELQTAAMTLLVCLPPWRAGQHYHQARLPLCQTAFSMSANAATVTMAVCLQACELSQWLKSLFIPLQYSIQTQMCIRLLKKTLSPQNEDYQFDMMQQQSDSPKLILLRCQKKTRQVYLQSTFQTLH